MIAASRRSILTGLVALIAAPAIVRAGSLMPVNSGLVPVNSGLMPGISMRELVEYAPEACGRVDVLYGKLNVRPEWGGWSNSPGFIERINAAYDEQFPKDNAKIGDVIRIRLPNDWTVVSNPATKLLSLYEPETMPKVPDSLALAAAAVAVAPAVLAKPVTPAVLAKPVTRRFWVK